MIPFFKRKGDGSLWLSDSQEAMAIKRELRQRRYVPPKSPQVVRLEAQRRVLRTGGDVENSTHLLGQFEIQFGAFRNQTFLWLAENALGYMGHLVASHEADTKAIQTNHNWINKMALVKYMKSFPEGLEAIAIKAEDLRKKKASTVSTAGKGDIWEEDITDQELISAAENVEGATAGPSISDAGVSLAAETSSSELDSRTAVTGVPSITLIGEPKTKWSKRSAASVPRQSVRDVMFSPPKTRKSNQSGLPENATSTGTETGALEPTPREDPTVEPPTSIPPPEADDYPIYAKWRDTLSYEDVCWISRALFTWTEDKRGRRAHLVMERVTKMWWYPHEPPFSVHRQPSIDQYFGHRLFLWMPHKLWHVRFTCPHDSCHDVTLTAAGIYNKIRTVLDVSSTYLMASEYMSCPSCKRKVISWNWNMIQQLDSSRQMQFPCILTAKKACDLRVVKLLRERSLGNSCSQVRRILNEQHSEEWLGKNLVYLTDCQTIQGAASAGLVRPISFVEPPKMLPVPQFKWLMQVYLQDVLMRLPDVKAEITCTFGRILKIDSTKKIVNKLAGPIRGTAAWATNVGNEVGQVLVSVITTGEGRALVPMAEGIMARYNSAGVPPPEVLYVDRDCCGSSPTRKLFHLWGDVPIKLDIWHFMRRIAGGVTSENHMLYASFMNQLSRCIFMWDPNDLEALKQAKLQELHAKDTFPSGGDVQHHLTKHNLALHCRRTTRGAAETTALIKKLLDAYKGAVDTLGVPLLKDEAMAIIWEKQRRHVVCIQDPPGVQLYQQTGTLRKGNTILPRYRCARGSTSLESFHLHLNRFIPGTMASEVLFQAYLVEGLARWNANRAAAAQGVPKEEPVSYSPTLREATNRLSEAVLGRKMLPSSRSPRKYTGEKIGLEYLLGQTGKADLTSMLEAFEDGDDVHPAVPTEEPQLVEEDVSGEVNTAATLTGPLIPTDIPTALVPPQTPPPAADVSTPVGVAAQAQPPVRAATPDLVPFPDDRPPTPPPAADVSTPADVAAPPTPVSVPFLADTAPTPPPAANVPTPTGVPAPPPLTSAHAHPPPVGPVAAPDLPIDPNPGVVDDSVGPDNLPGFGAVQNLADYLIKLADGNLALTSLQSTEIIRLWNALSPYDRRRTNFQERYNPYGYHKFRAPKTDKHPGVQSLECSVRAPDSIPAARPDCNRYVEAVVQRLCHRILSPNKTEGTRWRRIMASYNNIQATVLNNGSVMNATGIQLPYLSHATLRAWYNNKLRRNNTRMLEQGLAIPDPPLTANTPLLAPVPVSLPDVPTQPSCSHQVILPPNTAGSVRPKTRKLQPRPAAPQAAIIQPAQSQLPVIRFVMVDAPSKVPAASSSIGSSFSTAASSSSQLHYNTARYQRKKAQELAEGKARRSYQKTKEERTCKKCGQPLSRNNHSNMWGAIYCPATSSETLAEFKQRRFDEVRSKKKK